MESLQEWRWLSHSFRRPTHVNEISISRDLYENWKASVIEGSEVGVTGPECQICELI